MLSTKISIALAGPNGRLGSQIRRAVQAEGDIEIGSLVMRGDPLRNHSPSHDSFDVLLDVSSCDGVIERLPVLLSAGKPLVTGVTGFSEQQLDQIRQAANMIPVLLSGNFSIGVNQLLIQVRHAARAFGLSASITIEETHHLDKKDYPSGTALMLAAAVQDGLGCELPIKSVLYPQIPENTDTKAMIITCIRKAGVVGEHSVTFTHNNEKVILGHTAISRTIFAEGAIKATRWIVNQKPGLYTMSDVLASKGLGE